MEIMEYFVLNLGRYIKIPQIECIVSLCWHMNICDD